MKQSISEYAEELSKRRRRERKYPVVPARMPAKFPKLSGIKAVLWDIYGTLLGHPMGDLADNSLMEKNTRQAFRETAREFGLEPFLDGDPAAALRDLYNNEIEKDHQRKKRRGVFSPEVKIERIWLRVLKQLQLRGFEPVAGEIDIEFALKVAYFFDDAQQLKVLYPGARETLEAIKEHGLRQGIISNAQFYTPLTLNMLLRDSENVRDEPMKKFFDQKLVFFSYQLGVGKPNPLSFEKASLRLKQMRIKPAQVAFVGNDMLYDMVLANKFGFKPVLFAGDRRSVILRKDQQEIARFEPDAVIKSLPQLLQILGLAHKRRGI